MPGGDSTPVEFSVNTEKYSSFDSTVAMYQVVRSAENREDEILQNE